MSANVDSMFSVREMPWHREGVILNEYPGSWAEARIPAGLEWDPIRERVYKLVGVDDFGAPRYEAIEGWDHIVHSGTGATLCAARDSYELITNTEMGEIVEAVLTQGNIKYETAGSLEGGRKVWALALLDEPIELPGDVGTLTLPYLAVTNRHEPGQGCTLRATAVRIVCANTFGASELEGNRTGATFTFRHTKNWRDRIDDAAQAVTGARRELAAYRELATELLGVSITEGQRELFVRAFIPTPPDGLITERVMNNIEAARTSLRDILASPTTINVAHTAYGLVQAAGEYLDHARAARTWETRLNRSILRPEPLKAKAAKLALAVANQS